MAPGSPTCGPFGEETTYISASGQVYNGTRQGLGPDFGNDDYDATIGNANYNALEVTLRYTTPSLSFLAGYTWSKSIDQASSISDPGNPYNFSATRALSAFDIPQNLVVSFQYNLPFDKIAHIRGLTTGWQLSGIMRINSGFPVSLHSDGDNSLMGSNPNGVNNYSLDLPDYNGQPLNINSNAGRNGQPYFNINAFTLERPGYSRQRFPPFVHRPRRDQLRSGAVEDAQLHANQRSCRSGWKRSTRLITRTSSGLWPWMAISAATCSGRW